PFFPDPEPTARAPARSYRPKSRLGPGSPRVFALLRCPPPPVPSVLYSTVGSRPAKVAPHRPGLCARGLRSSEEPHPHDPENRPRRRHGGHLSSRVHRQGE